MDPKPNTPFFAVAADPIIVKNTPFDNVKWIPLKAKEGIRFTNCQQVHFPTQPQAQVFYDFIKSKDKLVFKNWK